MTMRPEARFWWSSHDLRPIRRKLSPQEDWRMVKCVPNHMIYPGAVIRLQWPALKTFRNAWQASTKRQEG